MKKDFYNTLRKNMELMAKVYSKDVDGEYYPQFGTHKMHTKLDRNFVHVRIGDALKVKTGDTDFQSITKDLNDDLYMVIVRVVKGSKKQMVFEELGFGTIKGIA